MNIVLIVNGIAGITAARTLRENNPKISISIYTTEDHMYYPRPRLYELLSGEAKPNEIYAFSHKWYKNRDFQIHLNNGVVKIHTSRKELLLEDHSKVHYDKLLLANGAHPFIPPINGIDKKGIFTLRSIKNVLAIKEYATSVRTVIIIGGGLLGLEFAVALRKLGLQVKIVEISPRLLPRQLDHDGSKILKELIEAYGIKIYLGVKTTEILGKKEVSGILLDNGKVLSCNFLLISAGIRANIDLALKAGINVNRGVIVDKYMQTSVNDVYAAGDVAEFEGRIYGIIPAAINQGKIAAMNMLGNNKYIYKGTIPSTLLKIVGIDLMSMGITNLEGSQYEEIKKIDKERGIYKKIVLNQEKIIGAIILGDKKDLTSIRRLINQELDVSKYKELLLEDNFDYGTLFT